MNNADILRDKFLKFFKARKHKVVESDSLVPADDPTVLFTPAGMNQFKKQFLGHISGFRRAASSQRCLRTDDLDKVGKTSGHHTFFEMLGNFSFGDYFKLEAISWAWEFLTQELKIDADKLWVSVYQDDAEAFLIWKDQIGLPEHKIVKLGDKDNFWPAEAKQKGPNGPCGPCSEIFFDFGRQAGCGRDECTPACGCNRFVEIWNLVFTQFNRKADGILEPLPKRNIDTGMGLERLTAVMQGARNNFETDLFSPIIKEISRHSSKDPTRQLLYAVADHLRSIVFAIYDGALPSNEARGYVVRKLIRKSVLHLRALGINRPFLFTLVPVVAQVMKYPYPELDKQKEDISQVIQSEEKSFIAILSSSDRYMTEAFEEPYNIGEPEKVADLMFKLTDTYGLPLEIIIEWLQKHGGIPVGALKLYDVKMEEQKNRSKAQSAMKGDVFSLKDALLGVTATKFLGYKQDQAKAKILKIIQEGSAVKKISKGQEAEIVLDKSPFYAESGGQVGDTGELRKGKNIFQVSDTKKFDRVVIHLGRVKEGSFKGSDLVLAQVDLERRLAIARNHTATHLLQAALRKVLGTHVKQQGSLVAPERLRFDFTHFKDIQKDELNRVEAAVNEYILKNVSLETKEMPLAAARKAKALAFFGEKYAGRVRVVAIEDFSRELCGGTHLESTGSVGLFKIVQEGSVAQGVRRIEAVTGKAAYQALKHQEDILADIAGILNTPEDRVAIELQKRIQRIRELEKELSVQRMDSAKGSWEALIEKAEMIKEVKVITHVYENLDMQTLRKSVDNLKQKSDHAVIALGARSADNKALLVVGITEDLLEKGLDASKLIAGPAKIIGGSGGGRKDFAQSGGLLPENFSQAFAELKTTLNNLI